MHHANAMPLAAAAAHSRHAAEKVAMRPRRRLSLGRAYVAAWLVFGLIAAGYLVTLAVQPDAVAGLQVPLLRNEPEPNVLDRTLAQLGGTVAGLQKSVGRLEGDVTALKGTVAASDRREKVLVDRVTTVESRLESFAAGRPLTTAAAGGQQGVQDRAAAAPRPAARVGQRPAQPAAIETGSITASGPPSGGNTGGGVAANAGKAALDAQPAPRELAVARIINSPAIGQALTGGSAAADQSALRKSVGVHLATGPSLDALRLSWSLLTDRHRSQLKALEPRAQSSDGIAYQLVAGPLKDEGEAQKLCATLRQRGITCRPADYAGEGL